MHYNKSFRFLLALVLLVLTACRSQEQSTTTQVPSSSIYAVSISVGGVHTCALLNNGHVLCWGDNSSGQLGDGTFTDHNTAAEVIGLADVVSISAGGEHTCALTKSGVIKCWGSNASGQLGIGTKQFSMKVVDVPDLTNVAAISAGSEHTCAVLNDGNVKCWGKNLNGRVGNGSNTRLILSPVDVVDLGASIIFISAGNEHTCAITKDGGVKCWGRNVDGELGMGQDKNLSKTPVDVVGLDGNVIALATGFYRSCAVTNDGSAKCWGWVGFQQFSNIPVDIGSLDGNAILIATGGDHICVVLASGEVNCIGENTKGQLGNRSTTDSQRFVKVKGLPSSVTAIGASHNYTCVLTTTGEVWCWGDNVAGQLGDGTTNNSSTPVKVIGINQ